MNQHLFLFLSPSISAPHRHHIAKLRSAAARLPGPELRQQDKSEALQQALSHLACGGVVSAGPIYQHYWGAEIRVERHLRRVKRHPFDLVLPIRKLV